ncbi:hypothetical protein [Nocardioides abyssi]|uniref:STAS domain-containing protein n=1 Tax=Nocardioides abyssi TaxID=3058370 RepID=A0ABT8ET21_9ACTN|nr:hypothetical protein [Nocardioides abyssi]MDN4161244.1 hypothetical protein [Nocardioides abyssi]
MSYGVLASRSATLLVEATGVAGGGEADAALDRFHEVWGGAWVPGRLTLTRLHVSFIPHRSGRGTAMLDLAVRELAGVEVGAGLVQKVLRVRTTRHVVSFRCLGAPALAQLVAPLLVPGSRRA